jgi:hypothetical protein
MAATTNNLLFVLLFVNLLSLINGQTQREIDNNPNDFHLFENFDLTKSIYQQEFKFVEKLQQLQKHLIKKQTKIRDFLKTKHQDQNTVG